ncbi:hypothetical protein QQF64_001596 [Cirrhinus molitorella]|uniref:Uncharacterized protein n=1 Tax=Cirrhinus molitorella TaxID=172907 RepID=A0ABR3P0J1_9TELE
MGSQRINHTVPPKTGRTSERRCSLTKFQNGRFSFRTCWNRASQRESETHSHTMTPSPPCRALVDADDMECSVCLQLSVSHLLSKPFHF